jgi:hypothetical protein
LEQVLSQKRDVLTSFPLGQHLLRFVDDGTDPFIRATVEISGHSAAVQPVPVKSDLGTAPVPEVPALLPFIDHPLGNRFDPIKVVWMDELVKPTPR